MSNPGFTQEVMKISPAGDHYDLFYRTDEETIDVFAHVPVHRHDKSETLRRANLLSASPLMLQALLDLLEYVQPDGWDEMEPEVSIAWRNTFVACAAATGEHIRWKWTPTSPHGSTRPSS
jgi:hypothetical protein